MRIVHIVSSWKKGGVEKFIESFHWNGLNAKKIIGNDFFANNELLKLPKKEKNVLCFHSPPYFLTILLNLVLRRFPKIVIFIHNDLESLYSPIKKIVIYPWLMFISLIGVKICYFSACNDFLRFFCLRAQKLGYMYENSEFKSKKSQKAKILFIARNAVDKNLEFAVEIFKSIPRDDVILEIWGDGYDLETKNKYPNSRIKFCGFTNDVNKIFSENAVLLITSDYESGPLTALEALARGNKVVTRRVGIFKHSINDQYGFWLFDKKEEAIDKIKIALDDQAEVDSNDFLRSITYTKQQYKEFFHSLIQ